MNSMTWPVTVFLSVFTVCVSGLVWKGSMPSHVLFTIIGLAAGYFPHAVVGAMKDRAMRAESKRSLDSVVEKKEDVS